MKTRLAVLVVLSILAALLLGGCTGKGLPSGIVEPPGAVGLPNPASVHCEEQGGTLEILADEQGGQYGLCRFADGSACEEWAFFRAECAPGQEFPAAPAP